MRKKTSSTPEYEILKNEQGFWWGFSQHPEHNFFERTSEAYFPYDQSCQQAIDTDRRTNNHT